MGYNLNRDQQRLNDVRVILKDMLKVIKVVAMYPEGNPLPESLRRSFSERLVALVQTYGDLRISVGKDTLSLDDETVFMDQSKEESLAALFFEPGITSLTFRDGLDVDEIRRFLDIIKLYNNSNRRTDLVAQIWECSFPHFSLTTVEDIALAGYEGDFRVAEMFGSDSGAHVRDTQVGTDAVENYNSIFSALDSYRQEQSSTDDSGGVQRPARRAAPSDTARTDVFRILSRGQDEEVVLDDDDASNLTFRTAEAVHAMGFADLAGSQLTSDRPSVPDTALILNDEFKLSEEEEGQVGNVLIDDAGFDMHESTIELLKEMLHQEVELSSFSESVGLCEKVAGEFITSARLAEAGVVLDYFHTLEDQLRPERPLWAERLKDARVSAGSRNRLKLLSDSLNQNADITGIDLRHYLDHFGWETLSGMVDLLGELDHESHRRALCDYLAVRGKDYVQILSKGLFDKRWFVVRNSVMILARIDDDRAIGFLEKTVHHEDRRVRLELMAALKEASSPRALSILQKAALDHDQEIRRQAIASLLAQRGLPAFEAVSHVVSSPSFSHIDQSDQQTLLNAYSSLGGEMAIEYLKSLIEQKSLWRDQAMAFYRAAAFEALCHNRSDKAEKLLVKLGSSWLPGVKQQAQAALKRRREIIFGGDRDHNNS